MTELMNLTWKGKWPDADKASVLDQVETMYARLDAGGLGWLRQIPVQLNYATGIQFQGAKMSAVYRHLTDFYDPYAPCEPSDLADPTHPFGRKYPFGRIVIGAKPQKKQPKWLSELLLHELGHAWWFQRLAKNQKVVFNQWVRRRTKPLTHQTMQQFALDHRVKDWKGLMFALDRRRPSMAHRVWKGACEAHNLGPSSKEPPNVPIKDIQIAETPSFTYAFSSYYISSWEKDRYVSPNELACEIFAEAFSHYFMADSKSPLPNKVRAVLIGMLAGSVGQIR